MPVCVQLCANVCITVRFSIIYRHKQMVRCPSEVAGDEMKPPVKRRGSSFTSQLQLYLCLTLGFVCDVSVQSAQSECEDVTPAQIQT